MTNAQRDKARHYIVEAITEWFGPRCPDFEPECPCCMTWAEFDRLTEMEAELDDTKEALRVVTWNRDVLIKSLNLKRIDGPEFRVPEAEP